MFQTHLGLNKVIKTNKSIQPTKQKNPTQNQTTDIIQNLAIKKKIASKHLCLIIS